MTGRKLSKLNSTFSTLKNETSKKVVSKISFGKNKINKASFIKNNSKINIHNNNNNLRKRKLINNAYNKGNEKDALGKIRAKISEIIKLINNNKLVKEYNYHTNNKQNSGLFNSNQRKKIYEIKSKNDISSNKSKNNKVNKIENRNNSKKNLYLSSSFLYKKKEKLFKSNNVNKNINFKI